MKKIIITLCSLLLAFADADLNATPLGTAFTYQGRLMDGANPANGTYYMLFTLHDALENGSQVASQPTNTVIVSSGLFTVDLDFGAEAFTGSARWLTINVRTNGGVGVDLAPRTRLAPAPHAIHASTAGVANTVTNGAIQRSHLGTDGAIPTAGQVLGYDGNSLVWQNPAGTPGSAWAIGGNNAASGNFLGTLNNQPLDLKVNGTRALRLEPNTSGAPNVIGGSIRNYVRSGVVGGTIGGGGAINFYVTSESFTNSVTANFATVGGGAANTSSGDNSTTSGGYRNSSLGVGATIGGGTGNTIQTNDAYSTISGGLNNSTESNAAFVGGGTYNHANGSSSTLAGGYDNTVSGGVAFIGGGARNRANNSFSAIAGGENNTASGGHAAVGGGYANTASGDGALVSGGENNRATGGHATVSGGAFTLASGGGSTVGGGTFNGASASDTTIAGGYGNSATANNAAIGGGNVNTASGLSATVPGGEGNVAHGAGSFAAGRNAHANHDGTFVWSDGTGTFNSGGPNRFEVVASGGVNFSTSFLTVSGAGSEQAYIGGDGVGGEVHVGSLNPATTTVALFNQSVGQYMHLNMKSCTIFGGADLAEPFQMSTSELPKGSVVVIDDENPGKLKRSNQAYDHRVAGIVSGANGVNPGIALQQQGVIEGGQNVALSGRVYVQAEAGNGPIKPGDLLTTSSTPGHAMKVRDHAKAQGAILGKAMSALEEGQGMVLVLVTLQ